MLQTDLSYFDCVKQALSGERGVDGQVLNSAAVLGDRLEGLKTLDPAFAGVEFSTDVKQLMHQDNHISIS